MIVENVFIPVSRLVKEEELEDLNDLENLLSVRCRKCGRKIPLANCSWDTDENPICFCGGYCR